ncbi:MurR/RpiR family transcriptional regulator [Bradyrhizobium liaoningense]|uniref:MurR/RpiR family transcriptional regulator n=1 Tax=Bradyrhizobium liaoningense TaxID=43992 RepID=UPI001BA60E2E|nr:MurR/RpiR family transcriptional regulator [Bradyrhizobium liaoningense]MBR0838876.1 MurR/RpiR family transcriptional regulator [Bradyrhizobium liaoningense]
MWVSETNPPIPAQGTVPERIRVIRSRLSPSEVAVASTIIDRYPTGGLVPIAQLAADAGVSGPTVLRLVCKLGFDGYGEFHAALRAEIQERILSPVDVYPAANCGGSDQEITTQAQAAYYECLQATLSQLRESELKSAVSVLSDPERPVYVLGGGVSGVLASHLCIHLSLLRPRVTHVGSNGFVRSSGIADLGPRSVVVVFDYRHYQETTVNWGAEAAGRKAHLVLFTDQYLSPLAQHATSLLTCSTKGLNPFDSLVGALALTELVVAEVARAIGAPANKRLTDLLALQQDNESRLEA